MIGSVVDIVTKLMSREASRASVIAARGSAAPRSSLSIRRTNGSPLGSEGREGDGLAVRRYAQRRDGPVRHRHGDLTQEGRGNGAASRRHVAFHHPNLTGIARVGVRQGWFVGETEITED